MQNEDDLLVARDDSGAEFVEIESVFNESVCQMGKLIRRTHANQVWSQTMFGWRRGVLRSATGRMRLGYRAGRASPVVRDGFALVQYPHRPSRHRGFLRASG